MKPNNLTNRSIRPTTINSYLIEKIEVDLKHINHGLDPKKGYGSKARSTFGMNEVAQFFESLDGLEASSEIDGNWEYFVVDKPFFEKKKKYRMVFCIDLREPNVSGVITFFEIKRGDS